MMGSSVCHRRGKYTASCGLLAKSSAEKKALHQQDAEKKAWRCGQALRKRMEK